MSVSSARDARTISRELSRDHNIVRSEIGRGFKRRQRDFNSRERDSMQEAETRVRNGLPDIDSRFGPKNAPGREKSLSLRSIRNEQNIGNLISQYLPRARDRSNLAPDHAREGFLAYPENRDTICLPTENTFRTNPDRATGCGPFASLDALNCCVQTDLAFCAKVAAVMKFRKTSYAGEDRFESLTSRVFNDGRIVREIQAWVQTYQLHLIPHDMEVIVDTSNNDDMQILKLSILMHSSVTINIAVSQSNEDLDPGLGQLGGIIHVRGNADGGSISFESLDRILREFHREIKKLVVHCPVDMTGYNLDDVTDMINSSWTMESIEYEFDLPVTIPVRSVGLELVRTPHQSGFNWIDRPRRNDGPTLKTTYVTGPITISREWELTYDSRLNRLTVIISETSITGNDYQ